MNAIVTSLTIITLLFVLYYFLSSSFQRHKAYKKAVSLQSQGKYKEACYQFALVLEMNRFSLDRYDCKKHIKTLWETYGPFDYNDMFTDIEKDDTPEHCGVAFHAHTVAIIQEIAQGKQQ